MWSTNVPCPQHAADRSRSRDRGATPDHFRRSRLYRVAVNKIPREHYFWKVLRRPKTTQTIRLKWNFGSKTQNFVYVRATVSVIGSNGDGKSAHVTSRPQTTQTLWSVWKFVWPSNRSTRVALYATGNGRLDPHHSTVENHHKPKEEWGRVQRGHLQIQTAKVECTSVHLCTMIFVKVERHHSRSNALFVA